MRENMIKKRIFCILSILSILALLFTGCKKKSKKIEVSSYVNAPYVTYHEDGSIDPLYINYNGSVAKLSDVDKEPSAQIKIKPEIKGSWKWSSDCNLVFTPVQNWELGTKYTVTLPQEIFSDSVKVNNEETFETEDFHVSLDNMEFYINPEDPAEKRVTAQITASHPIDKENFNSHISLTLELKKDNSKTITNQSYKFNVSYNSNATEAYIVSDVIPIPPKTSEMKITVSKGIKTILNGTSKQELTDYTTVPGMSDFVCFKDTYISLVKNDQQNYDQIVTITTKGKVTQEELQKHITIYELPKDRPEMQGYDAEENAYWSTQMCTGENLKKSKKLNFEFIPNEENACDVNSLKIKATENRYIYIYISSDVNFFGGYRYLFDYNTVLQVPSYPEELGILSEGAILSLSGSKKIAMFSRGINKVEYELARIMPKDINHLISMSNGSMRHFDWSTYNFTENNISEKQTYRYSIPDYSREYISYFSYDFTSDLKPDPSKNLKNGLFLFSVGKLDENNNRSLIDKRFILVTDLGIIVKKNSDNTKDVFVQSLSTGNPVSNAKIDIIGLNGNSVLSTSTDSHGHAELPKLPYTTDEHRPIAYVVKTSNDLSFMPYSGSSTYLDYSNFDVGGEYTSTDLSKIKSYLFCDRGIYRPGDSVNLGIISKAGDWNINLKGIPLECEVKDSKSSVIFTKRFALDQSGLNEITFDTQDYSPTGEYTVNLYLIKEYSDHTEREYLDSTKIKVEEFLPDTLNLTTGFDPIPQAGWINPGELKGTVSLKNLFGTPACGNEVKAQLTLTPGFPYLRKYSDYHFSDPYSNTKSYDEFLGTQETDENGETFFEIDTKKFEKATYRLSFYVEAYEKGSGRNVSKEAGLYVSPLKYLIGYKADGSLNYINKDSVRKLSFIGIDQNLNKIKLDDINLTIEEIKYVSTLVRQPNGLFKYQSVKKPYLYKSEKISVGAEGTDYIVPSDKPGEYRITLTNAEGLIFNKINYSIIGNENITRSLTRTAELELTLEKSDLSANSDAKLFIKAPYTGYGLITVERDKVYSYKWFKMDTLSSVQTIKIPSNLEGNGYVNVMFTRNLSSEEIFMSPFCYGAVPFFIDKESRTNKIKIDIPDEIKSGNDLNINYTASREGKIIVYAVDEGILQVGHYSLPDPLAYFFRKRALQVGTSQILDLLLPEFNVLKTLTAMGGGGDMDALSKNLNPFKRKQNKPVVFWSGIIDCGPETKSVSYHIPDYFNGTLRVMAVAVSNDSIGTAQETTVASNTFVITPNTPLAAAPGDEFDVSVTVTNKHKNSGANNKVTVSCKPSANLELVNYKAETFAIDEGKDVTINYRVKAKNILGNAELLFTAKDASESSTLSATMSIRPSMPYQIWITNGNSTKKQEIVNVKRSLYDEYATREVSVSNVPAAFLDNLEFFLEKFPHGCSEQITSQTYPYLYEDFVKAGGKTHKDAEEAVRRTIGILQSRLKPNGHVGYWTSASTNDNFITCYVAEFLTEAKAQGFYVPDSLFDKVIDRVSSIASGYESDAYNIYIRSYAIYILTKTGIVTTSYIEKLDSYINNGTYDASGYEGLYLAATYAMLKQDNKANKILAKIKFEKTFDSSWIYHNRLHYIATYIEVISRYFPKRISDIKSNEINLLCDSLEMNYYTTLSTSALIRAFESFAYIDKTEIFKVFETKAKTDTLINMQGDAVLKGNYSKNADSIKFTSTREMPMYYSTLTAGFETSIPEKPIAQGLEVYREFEDEKGNKLNKVKLGDDVYVKISFRCPKGQIYNIAFIDLQPAGLEADIDSARNPDSNFTPDYVDIREDRIVIYATATDEARTFRYKAKAINTGTYIVPPMFAESMYNKDIRAITPHAPITIEKNNIK